MMNGILGRGPVALAIGVVALMGGCGNLGPPSNGNEVTDAVAQKATDVASQIGGPNGFGGPMMSGYLDHAPTMMGFINAADLADPSATQTIVLRNESSEEATFHLTYFASYLGQDDRSQDVVVGAGQAVEVEIPCSEIVGMGPLAMPGGIACHLAGGLEVANTMAIPVFLGMDYSCSEEREFVLTPDSSDLDFDDDVDEIILLSDGLVGHMQLGGPLGHSHRGGMMGSHMMMGDFDRWDDSNGSWMMGGRGAAPASASDPGLGRE